MDAYPKGSNSLEYYKLLAILADTYKALSDRKAFEANYKMSLLLEKKSKEHYELALKGLTENIALMKENNTIDEEWICTYDFIKIDLSYFQSDPVFFDSAEPSKAKTEIPQPEIASQVEITPEPVTMQPLKQEMPSLNEHPFELSFSPWEKEILDLVAEQNKVFVVGGKIRSQKTKDLDVVTNGNLEQLANLLKDKGKIQLIGRKKPILRIHYGKECIDIAPLSNPIADPSNLQAITLDNGRVVYYTPTESLCIDASQRDFTVNALYYDYRKKVLLDPTRKGENDLYENQIRTILSPTKSFEEDPIRIIRLARIMIQDGSTIDSEIADAILANAHRLQTLKEEERPRLLQELNTILSSDKKAEILYQLNALGALEHFLPAAHRAFSQPASISCQLIEAILHYDVSSLNSYPRLSLFLAVLFWDTVQLYIDQNKSVQISEFYSHLLDFLNQTLATEKQKLGIPQELIDQIYLIWRHYTSTIYKQKTGVPDTYTLEKVPTSEEYALIAAFNIIEESVISMPFYSQESLSVLWPTPLESMTNRSLIQPKTQGHGL